MRKILFLLGSLFFIFFLLFTVLFYPHATRVVLERGLASAGVKERQIIYSGQFMLRDTSYSTMDKELEKLKESLALKTEQKRMNSNPFGDSGQLVSPLTTEAQLSLNLDTFHYFWQGKEKFGKKLRFELASQNMGLDQQEREYLKKIVNLAKDGKKDLLISTCLFATISGKLNEEQQYTIKDKVFRAAFAKEKQRFSYGPMSTYSGYTPLIPDSFFAEGKRINLQLVIRYDKKTNLTTILLGSPIIDIEY